MKLANRILAVTLTILLGASVMQAQTPSTDTRQSAPAPPLSIKTFYLANVSQASDANELYTALRNMLPPQVKSYLIPSKNAIMVQGTPDQLDTTQKVLSDLDRPRKNYRLTYTVTEFDATKRVGTQHFAMILSPGQQTVLKQGSKVPVATGSYSAGSTTTAASGTVQTQFTYLDIGMNFDATLIELANGVSLRTSVEQSSIAQEKSGVGEQDPIVRQTSLRNSSFLTPGKPLMIGSVDVPGSTRRLDIEVVMEQLP
jgi:type II secretory pathway component GspD/PulD (secretin)